MKLETEIISVIIRKSTFLFAIDIVYIFTSSCHAEEHRAEQNRVKTAESNLKLHIHKIMMADLGSELPLPVSGDFRAGADLLVNVGGLRRLTQVLSDTGLQGLLAHEQGRLQFLFQQQVMFGLLHLRKEGEISQSLTTESVPHLNLRESCLQATFGNSRGLFDKFKSSFHQTRQRDGSLH